MTNEEAIEELNSRKLTMSMCIDIESYKNANNALDIAINSIQENIKLKAEIEEFKKVGSDLVHSFEQSIKELTNEKVKRAEIISKVFDLEEEMDELKVEIERLIELMPKECETCEHEYMLAYEEPCDNCKNKCNWKLKGKVEQ